MRKVLAITALLLSTSNAFASLDVTASVYRIDFNLKLYEVCGKVTGATNPMGLHVDIQVDSGKNEGHYITSTDANGTFCQIVRVFGNQLGITAEELTTASRASSVLVVK